MDRCSNNLDSRLVPAHNCRRWDRIRRDNRNRGRLNCLGSRVDCSRHTDHSSCWRSIVGHRDTDWSMQVVVVAVEDTLAVVDTVAAVVVERCNTACPKHRFAAAAAAADLGIHNWMLLVHCRCNFAAAAEADCKRLGETLKHEREQEKAEHHFPRHSREEHDDFGRAKAMVPCCFLDHFVDTHRDC